MSCCTLVIFSLHSRMYGSSSTASSDAGWSPGRATGSRCRTGSPRRSPRPCRARASPPRSRCPRRRPCAAPWRSPRRPCSRRWRRSPRPAGSPPRSTPGARPSCRCSSRRPTARSMPRLTSTGFAPPSIARIPSRTTAWASTVAVVVPSPTTSLVLIAASLTSCAPMFSNWSRRWISRAIVTPSLVTTGDPVIFSRITLRPFGPSVDFTASASWSTPASNRARASAPKRSSFAIVAPLQKIKSLIPNEGVLTPARESPARGRGRRRGRRARRAPPSAGRSWCAG